MADLERDERIARENMEALGYTNIVLPAQGGRTVVITYAVDLTPAPPPPPGQPPTRRSGRVVATYQVMLNYQATNRAGQPVTAGRHGPAGTVLVYDQNLVNMELRP